MKQSFKLFSALLLSTLLPSLLSGSQGHVHYDTTTDFSTPMPALTAFQKQELKAQNSLTLIANLLTLSKSQIIAFTSLQKTELLNQMLLLHTLASGTPDQAFKDLQQLFSPYLVAGEALDAQSGPSGKVHFIVRSSVERIVNYLIQAAKNNDSTVVTKLQQDFAKLTSEQKINITMSAITQLDTQNEAQASVFIYVTKALSPIESLLLLNQRGGDPARLTSSHAEMLSDIRTLNPYNSILPQIQDLYLNRTTNYARIARSNIVVDDILSKLANIYVQHCITTQVTPQSLPDFVKVDSDLKNTILQAYSTARPQAPQPAARSAQPSIATQQQAILLQQAQQQLSTGAPLSPQMISAVKALSVEAKTTLINAALDSYKPLTTDSNFLWSFNPLILPTLQPTETFFTMNSKTPGETPRLFLATLQQNKSLTQNMELIKSNPQAQFYAQSYQFSAQEITNNIIKRLCDYWYNTVPSLRTAIIPSGPLAGSAQPSQTAINATLQQYFVGWNDLSNEQRAFCINRIVYNNQPRTR